MLLLSTTVGFVVLFVAPVSCFFCSVASHVPAGSRRVLLRTSGGDEILLTSSLCRFVFYLSLPIVQFYRHAPWADVRRVIYAYRCCERLAVCSVSLASHPTLDDVSELLRITPEACIGFYCVVCCRQRGQEMKLSRGRLRQSVPRPGDLLRPYPSPSIQQFDVPFERTSSP